MSRIRADDYDAKMTIILNAAASLFAEHGYAGSKMEQIAERCNVSKSMLYHYFKKKEDVLFTILQEHVKRLITLIDAHVRTATFKTKEEFFRGFIKVYLDPSKDTRARHVVALVDMRYLNDEQKRQQIELERKLLELVSDVVKKLGGNEDPVERKAYCMLLLGMLNWVEMWYKPAGKISPTELYDRVAQLFMSGFLTPYVMQNSVSPSTSAVPAAAPKTRSSRKAASKSPSGNSSAD